MANLLLNQLNWRQASTTPPPVYYSGKYGATSADVPMILIGAVAPGDVVSCNAITSYATPPSRVRVLTSAGVFIADWNMTVASQNFSVPAQAGMQLVFSTEAYNGFITMTPDIPIVQAPIAGNTSLTITASLYQAALTPSADYNGDAFDTPLATCTLGGLRTRLLVRLGFASQTTTPGMTLLMNDFLIEAQELLYRKYDCFKTSRWFYWNMVIGQRFYGLASNNDASRAVYQIDPRQVEWCGISNGDDNWMPMEYGIDPQQFRSAMTGTPYAYEIAQVIQVWPAPSTANWILRMKGDFGLLPFAADTDSATIDCEAIFLLALASAKLHYGRPDAARYDAILTGYIGDLTAGTGSTRRFVPGEKPFSGAVRPIPKTPFRS